MLSFSPLGLGEGARESDEGDWLTFLIINGGVSGSIFAGARGRGPRRGGRVCILWSVLSNSIVAKDKYTNNNHVQT